MSLIERTDSVLVVIDAQERFYRDHRIDVDRYVLAERLDVVAWVTGAAAALDVPIVVTEEDADRNGPTAAPIRAHLPQSTPVLAKHAFSAADNPPILAAIEAPGRHTCVIVGLETDICVAHTALQLQERGRRVVVVHDATFSPRRAHENGLARLERAGIELLSAKELIYDWVRTVEQVRQFCEANPALADPPGFHL